MQLSDTAALVLTQEQRSKIIGVHHLAPLKNLLTAALAVIVNPSGKAGAQIPQLPLGDNSPPWGDNAVCT
jgi:hypothetical protein